VGEVVLQLGKGGGFIEILTDAMQDSSSSPPPEGSRFGSRFGSFGVSRAQNKHHGIIMHIDNQLPRGFSRLSTHSHITF
jgi:hypothetical protein